MFKVVIFDLDDTLLRNDKTISNFSLEILKKLQSKGIKIFINSARDFENTLPIINILNPDCSIINGGSLIVDKDCKPIYESFVDPQAAKKILNFIKDNNLKAKIVANEGTFVTSKDEIKYDALIDFNTFDFTKTNIYKFVVRCYDEQKLIKFCRDNDVLLTQYFDGPWFRIVNKEVTKAKGNEKACEFFNCTSKDAICFGDDIGDIDMLKDAGKGVCMANSQQLVLDTIKDHCFSNEEDGVANYLKKEFNL